MERMGRRGFLGIGAGAAFGAFAGAGAGAGEEGGWRPRLCASSIAFQSLSIEGACERVAALGFEGIDVWSAHAGCPHLDDVQARLGAEGLKGLLARHRLRLCAFSVYAGGYPRYAALLGACGGGLAIRGSARPAAPGELTAAMRRFFEGIRPEIELCERYDSRLAIENHGHALLDSLESLRAFVDLCPSPRVGIALAPYHLQACGVRVEDAVVACGSRLMFFYAWQKADGLGQLPGRGPQDFAPWLGALARAGYAGDIVPFLHHQPGPEETAAALGKARGYLLERAPGRP